MRTKKNDTAAYHVALHRCRLSGLVSDRPTRLRVTNHNVRPHIKHPGRIGTFDSDNVVCAASTAYPWPNDWD
jgi:hypothetical protein